MARDNRRVKLELWRQIPIARRVFSPDVKNYGPYSDPESLAVARYFRQRGSAVVPSVP
jgi:hypothetical protein